MFFLGKILQKTRSVATYLSFLSITFTFTTTFQNIFHDSASRGDVLRASVYAGSIFKEKIEMYLETFLCFTHLDVRVHVRRVSTVVWEMQPGENNVVKNRMSTKFYLPALPACLDCISSSPPPPPPHPSHQEYSSVASC